MKIITPEIKDIVLRSIIAKEEAVTDISYSEIFPDGEISKRQFELILIQFVEMGLLRRYDDCGDYFLISVSANIYDYFRHGGFVAQEEILKANIEKLDYELTKLARDIDPSFSDRISKITSIASSITTVLGLFK